MSLKCKYICIFFLLSFLFLTADAHAETEAEQNNELFIEVKNVDYTNYLLSADISIHLNVKARDEFSYLILPINYNPNLNFYIEPNSKKATILFGYLEGNGNFIAQFPPSLENAEYFLTFTDVQIPIIKASNDETFGYYSISFSDINEDISSYERNLFSIDKIHLKDSNLLFSNPNAVQENSKDSLLFSFSDTPYNILIYISRQQTNTNFVLPIIIAIAAIMLGIISALGLGLDKRIKDLNKYRNLFRVASIIVIALELGFFCLYIYPRGYYNDLTFMSTISTLFGVTIGLSVVIFFSIPKHAA